MTEQPENPSTGTPSEPLPTRELLQGISQPSYKRGHHKIIIGAAPGVGKTYRMLQEAHLLRKMGVDVVVGYMEPHGRKDTELLLEGLEVIPRQKIDYKGIALEEMDTRAIIERKPKIVLIDELAHTNVPGSFYKKRYEDVQDILEAGISVVSTVNIQHIESLNDMVTRITGIHVNERVPDSVIDDADEVVLVDISVEELQERLQKGKIYPREKIEQSLNNFFKKGNLIALRELALREVANNVEEQAEGDIIYCPLEPTGIHERVLVCISTHPNAQRLIRRGFRLADRLCGELFVIYVHKKGRQLPQEWRSQLEKHRQLTVELEGKFIETEAVNIVNAIVEISKQKKITQIIVGESMREPGLFSFLQPALPYRIFQKTDNIDVYIIATGR